MPYIKQSDREKFTGFYDHQNLATYGDKIKTAGELNYAITMLCHYYIKNKGKSYATLNEVHGVLSCADKELYRTVTAPYEDTKIIENGRVSKL